MPDKRPQTIGRIDHKDHQYHLRELIGGGGGGVVYRAFDSKLQREVALKTIKTIYLESLKRTSEGRQIIDRFNREAQIVAKLNHPNIVPIYDYLLYDGNNTPYIAMKHLTGGTLSERITFDPKTKRVRLLAGDEALRIINAISDALHYCHTKVVLRHIDKHGEEVETHPVVIHRDIKPDNILFDEHNQLYLVDFGLTRDLTIESDVTMNFRIGTRKYMAPEQIDPERYGDASPLSDQYALAVLAYYILSGAYPYDVREGGVVRETTGDSTDKQYDDYLVANTDPTGRPRLITFFRPDLSSDVQAVLEKGLEKNPRRRFASIDLFTQALNDALHGRTINIETQPRTNTSKRSTQTQSMIIPAQRASVPIEYVILGVVILLFVGVGILVWNETNRTDNGVSILLDLAATQTQAAIVALAITETQGATQTQGAIMNWTTETAQAELEAVVATETQVALDEDATGTAVVIQERIATSTALAMTDIAMDAQLTAASLPTATETSTATASLTLTATATATLTATVTPTATTTSTTTATVTATPTSTPTTTPTATATFTPTNTATLTVTPTEEIPVIADIALQAFPTLEGIVPRAYNGLIYFSSDVDTDSNFELYAVGIDGGGLRRITFSDVDNIDPTVSPDGNRLAYITTSDSGYELRVINVVGGRPSVLVQSTNVKSSPVWSPDGLSIIYETQSEEGVYRLWRINLGDDSPSLLTDGTFNARTVSWSPDGRAIVYQADPEVAPGLYVMNADGTETYQLSPTLGLDFHPAWSPVDERIMFYSTRDGGGLHMMHADGSNLQFVVSVAEVNNVSWLGDGSGVVFCTRGDAQIYIFLLESEEIINVIRNTAQNRCPSG